MQFNIERIKTERKYEHKAVLNVSSGGKSPLCLDIAINLTGGDLDSLFNKIGAHMTAHTHYEFEEEVDGFTYVFNIDPAEDGGREYPSTPENIEDLAIVINGMAIPFEDEIDGLEETLMDRAAESVADNFDEPDYY